jgi:hypothetical protein
VTGGSVEVVGGGVVVVVGGVEDSVTYIEPAAEYDRADFPEAVAVSSICSSLTAACRTQTVACSSSAWPVGSVPTVHDEVPALGQTVKCGPPTCRTLPSSRRIVTDLLAVCVLHTQTANRASCPGRTREEPVSGCTDVHSCGVFFFGGGGGEVLGGGLGLFVVVFVGLGLGLPLDGFGLALVLDGFGLGLLLVGDGLVDGGLVVGLAEVGLLVGLALDVFEAELLGRALVGLSLGVELVLWLLPDGVGRAEDEVLEPPLGVGVALTDVLPVMVGVTVADELWLTVAVADGTPLSEADPLADGDPLDGDPLDGVWLDGDWLDGVWLDGDWPGAASSRIADLGRLAQAPFTIGGPPSRWLATVAANTAGLEASNAKPVNVPSATGRTSRPLAVRTGTTSPL